MTTSVSSEAQKKSWNEQTAEVSYRADVLLDHDRQTDGQNMCKLDAQMLCDTDMKTKGASLLKK